MEAGLWVPRNMLVMFWLALSAGQRGLLSGGSRMIRHIFAAPVGGRGFQLPLSGCPHWQLADRDSARRSGPHFRRRAGYGKRWIAQRDGHLHRSIGRGADFEACWRSVVIDPGHGRVHSSSLRSAIVANTQGLPSHAINAGGGTGLSRLALHSTSSLSCKNSLRSFNTSASSSALNSARSLRSVALSSTPVAQSGDFLSSATTSLPSLLATAAMAA